MSSEQFLTENAYWDALEKHHQEELDNTILHDAIEKELEEGRVFTQKGVYIPSRFENK